ncbi:MAG: ATP-binding protein [Flavobacteriales bacterium]|nr:ATP-binding protein [Flavobacteriales bacterium]
MQTEQMNSISFPSEICNVSKVESLVTEAVSAGGICTENFGKILIALTEAVNNAILHGNLQDPTKKVHISFETENRMVFFHIKDEGCGFNPSEIPDPTDPENLEKPNGRGVFLMQRLADTCEFLNSGCEVRLGFKIEPENT